MEEPPLFAVEMQWGQQPVRLTAYRCTTLPGDAPTTTVHIVAFHGEKVLVVRDRRGVHGFPGGRLESGETYAEALAREVYEEARAHLKPEYTLFAVLRIDYLERLPGRIYPNAYSYMAMYAGWVRALEPIGHDPAGIITARALFSRLDCEKQLLEHDAVLLQEALKSLAKRPNSDARPLRAFAGFLPSSRPLPQRPAFRETEKESDVRPAS